MQSGESTVTVVEQTPVQEPAVTPEAPQIVSTQNEPQKVELSPDNASAAVSVGQKTTIVINPDASHPDGVKMTVTTHKTHREYFIEFVRFVASLLKRNK